MKDQYFGIEVEMTGITRNTAAKILAGYFRTDATHIGGYYDAYTIRDNGERQWKIIPVFRIFVRNMRTNVKGKQYRQFE